MDRIEKILKLNQDIAHIYNKEYYPFRRDGYFQVQENIKRSKSVIITGLRQIGKSTIMKQLCADNSKDGIYLTLLTGDTRNNIEKIISSLYFDYHKKIFFIDEIQNINNWGNWIIDIFNQYEKAIFIVGGSASIKTSETSGSARFRDVNILPLSIKEYIAFTNDNARGKQLLNNYLGKNSITAYTNEDISYLQIKENYFDTYVYKDILKYEKNRSIDEIAILLEQLKNNNSGEFSYSKLSETIYGENNTNNNRKIIKLISLLKKYKILKTLVRKNLDQDVSKRFKIYIDPHLYLILNQSSFQELPNSKQGYLFESLLLFYYFNDNAYYIKQTGQAKKYAKQEIDFVLDSSWYEIKATDDLKQARKELNKLFREYNSKNIKEKYVFYLGPDAQSQNIKFLNINNKLL